MNLVWRVLVLGGAAFGLSSKHLQPRISSTRLFDSTLTAVKPKDYTTIPLQELLSGAQQRGVTAKMPTGLKNKYFGLRHGESTANLEGIISSDLKVGSTTHGLTPEGRGQARRAAVDLISLIGRESLLEPDKVVLVSSPFTRARETAAEALSAMSKVIAFENEVYGAATPPLKGSKWIIPSPVDRCVLLQECDLDMSVEMGLPDVPVVINDKLRERFFGEFDAKPLIWYNRVWPYDQVDALNKRHCVESVDEVCRRCASLIQELEQQYQDKVVVFSSHADTLQIFQLFMSGVVDPRFFADYRFRNGEARNMLSLQAQRVHMVYR